MRTSIDTQPPGPLAITNATRLTISRIVLAPILLGFLLMHQPLFAIWLSAAVFLVAALTDFLDGRLARQRNEATLLGVFLDGAADKILVLCALLGLLVTDRANIWIVFVILAREFGISGLRSVAPTAGIVIHPSGWGKLKFIVQVAAITLAILNPPVLVIGLSLAELAMGAAALVSVASAIDYFVRFVIAMRRQPA